MLTGTALVIGSGLYTLLREARLRLRSRHKPSTVPVTPV